MIGGADSIAIHTPRIRPARRRLAQFALLLAALTFSVGCGGGDAPQVYRVTGKVLRGGQPVPNVAVNFVPDAGRPSFAVSDAAGDYRLGFTRSIEGALPGKHRVVISVMASRPGTPGPSADVQAILDKYGEQKSTYFVEVTEDGQVIDLQLD